MNTSIEKKKVVIIGAGASGLAAIKSSLEEGLEPICFEQADYIGGLWKFTEEQTHSSVYRSTIINTSKEMMSFSDFPIPSKYPTFMHHSEIIEYFELYAQHFELKKHIQFNTKVVAVEPIGENYKQAGAKGSAINNKWRITVENIKTGEKASVDAEAVMVCSGHHWNPHVPSFPGLQDFKGIVMHSKEYKDFKPFENKKVVVIGVGNSGVDVAVELSRHCPKVYLSTRSGAWIMSRLTGAAPGDHIANSRFISSLPLSMKASIFEKKLKERVGDPALYPALNPKHGVFQAQPTVNGEFFGRLAAGSVIAKPNIKQIHEDKVEFDDGSVVDADAIVLCTGYTISFPFLDKSIITIENNKVDLYMYSIHPEFGRSLSFLGLVQPLGAIMPVAEMQARYISYLIATGASMASKKEMLAEILERQKRLQARFGHSQRHTIQTDYVDIMDAYAKHLGAVPDWKEYLKKGDVKFAWKLLYGPLYPQTYRLNGRGAWKGARKAIEKMYWNTLHTDDYKRYYLETTKNQQ